VSFDFVLWLLVVGLALYAGWLTLPRSVDLDWERFFKLSLVTLVRGPLEEQEASSEQWMEAGRSQVWYHPAARDLGLKVQDPAGYEPPFPTLDGERALLEQLQLTAPEQRLATVFGGGADEVLYDDPEGLGGDWQLATILGPEVSWESVATWSAELLSGLARRHEHTRWALLGAEHLAETLREALGEGSVLLAPEDDPAAFFEQELSQLSDRVVFLASGKHADQLVRLLHEHPGLRDKARAVVALQASFDPEWMAACFGHESMDTEIAWATPYFHLFFAGDGLQGLESSRWPTPPVPATGRVSVESVDLGVLPGSLEGYDARLLARALLVTVTARVALSG